MDEQAPRPNEAGSPTWGVIAGLVLAKPAGKNPRELAEGLGLEFNGAVRATDYSTAGYVTTWRAGATWQPIEDIRLRVTRSRDIRAPNLSELFSAGVTIQSRGRSEYGQQSRV